MAQSSTIGFLINLARQQTDSAARKLGAAIRQVDDLNGKLNLLNTYRDDYSLKMQNQLKMGCDMQHIRNFQQFLVKIDDAISGQKKLVNDAQLRINVEKLNWQEQEKKRLSYTILQDRAEQAKEQKEAKRDQLQSDEHGARQAYYKQS